MKYYVIKRTQTIYEGICDNENHKITKYYRKAEDGTFQPKTVDDVNIDFLVDKARKDRRLRSFPNLQMAIEFIKTFK
jgi:hypothetical protein